MTQRRLFGFIGRSHGSAAPRVDTASQLPKREYLRTIDIFGDLRPEEIDEIDKQTQMITCPRGRVLFSQEDRAEALFLLKRGRVQLYRLTSSGKRLDVATIGPGTFFGEMPLLGESLRHTYAESLDDSMLCVMSRGDVERLIRQHPSVAVRMVEALGQRLALSEARLEEMAYRSVPTRIAAVLLRLSQARPNETVLITHQELGDMIGALRETVTKILDEFQADGLVELGRGRILLRDVARLRAHLDE